MIPEFNISKDKLVNDYLNERNMIPHDLEPLLQLEDFSSWIKYPRKIEDIDGELLADLRNKLTPVLNLCKMIKNGQHPLYDNEKINELLNVELEKTIEIIEKITKKNEIDPYEDLSDFERIIKMVGDDMYPIDREDFLEFTDKQTPKDALRYKEKLKIPDHINWTKGCYVLDAINCIYYIIDDSGKWIGFTQEIPYLGDVEFTEFKYITYKQS